MKESSNYMIEAFKHFPFKKFHLKISFEQVKLFACSQLSIRFKTDSV